MNKITLKRTIKSFATNCALATAMFVVILNYAMTIWLGEGMIWLLVCDILCFAGDIFCAINDWKNIKKMLEVSE